MLTAAFAAWAFTALGGLTLAMTWISHGGMRQETKLQEASLRDGGQYTLTAERREQWHGLSSTLVFGHGALALVGLAAWGGYALTGENRAAAPITALFLIPIVALGLTMFTRWQKGASEGGEVGPEVRETPADRHLSPALVYIHGLSALVTVVLVVVAAITVA
jgi:hypothetical protein